MDYDALVAKIRQQMELPDEIMNRAEVMIKRTLPLLAENGISFDEYSLIGFCSHLANLASRMNSGETLAPICEEVLSELDADIMKLSADVTDIWKNTYSQQPDNAELVLIATHLQTAKVKAAK